MAIGRLALAPVWITVACAAGAAPPAAPTVPLVQLATNIEDYRGQTVRTCGRRLVRTDGQRVWQLSVPRAFGHHPAGVLVLPCGELRPPAGDESCVTGRVARRDGSTEPTQEGQLRIVSSAVINHNWYLHAQCTPAAGS